MDISIYLSPFMSYFVIKKQRVSEIYIGLFFSSLFIQMFKTMMEGDFCVDLYNKSSDFFEKIDF